MATIVLSGSRTDRGLLAGSQFSTHSIQGTTLSAREYFLGSIVLVTSGGSNLLLDGQRRLATATILLSVLREARRGL
jgi:uncharacterized protein with ParB-like and HNH nuclease domain